MVDIALRNEALAMLHGESKILDVAREVSGVLRSAEIPGAIIGGVAVVLHGYVRTTLDVDVWTPEPAERLAEALKDAGFVWNRSRREFAIAGVPVHLVLTDQTGREPARRREIDGITTVSLADLINLKLRSGTKSVLRAIDLADVIGLIRANRLGSSFAVKIDKPLRAEFRKLVTAIRNQK